MKRIDLLGKTQELDCVFLSIVCKDMIPYKKHYNDKERLTGILTIKRHEGNIGFLGGKVDEGETLYDALVREVYEEGNIDISDYLQKIEPVCSHAFAGADIHHFTLEVSRDEILGMARSIIDAEHFGEEITGFSIDLVHPKTVDNILENNFKATAGLEMRELINRIISSDSYKDMNWV